MQLIILWVGRHKKGLEWKTLKSSMRQDIKELGVWYGRKVFSWWWQETACKWDRTGKSSVGEDKKGLVGGTGQKSLQMVRQEKNWMGQDREVCSETGHDRQRIGFNTHSTMMVRTITGHQRRYKWDRIGMPSVGQDRKSVVWDKSSEGGDRKKEWDGTGKSSVGQNMKGTAGGTGEGSFQLDRTGKDLKGCGQKKHGEWDTTWKMFCEGSTGNVLSAATTGRVFPDLWTEVFSEIWHEQRRFLRDTGLRSLQWDRTGKRCKQDRTWKSLVRTA